jgi:putative membrane protein
MARCRSHEIASEEPERKGHVMHKSLVIGAFLAAGLLTMAASAAEQAGKPTDPQIAHIVYTANLLDIETAKQALQKSKNEGVRAFAQQMVGDHTTVNNQALALVKKLNVTPEDNPTSQSLKKQADATRNKLASLNGAAFDKAYVDNEVAYHKTVNNALSDTLIPSAQNAELKALLQSGLALFQAHQKHAEQLSSQLQSASASQ